MTKRKVVVTGAAGTMAGLILSDLHERYDLTLLDVKTTHPDGHEVEGVQIADVLDKNRDVYREHFRGADAVVHCSFIHAANPDNPDERFQAEMNNVLMVYNVLMVSWEERVRRVVVMSSNHAASAYENWILDGTFDTVIPDETIPYSASFYGWAKNAYESLGFTFALGQQLGRPLENVHIRIGAPRETDIANCEPGDLRRVRRAMGAYMSRRDMAQLFIKSIETGDIRNEHGVPFQVFYGVSANTSSFWSIANARKVLGYLPEDDSLTRFHDQIIEHIRAARERSKG